MDIPTPTQDPIFSAAGFEKVVASIVEVTKRVQNIPKLGKNSKDGYDYVRWTDMAAKLQDALAHADLVFAQRQVSRRVENKVLMIGYTFDALHASGQYVLNITSSTGSCRFEFKSGVTDDKAPGKAQTAGLKSAVMSLFKISADADQDIERDTFDLDDRPARGNGRGEPPREPAREAYREPYREPPREAYREPPREPPPGEPFREPPREPARDVSRDPGRDYPPRDGRRDDDGPPPDAPAWGFGSRDEEPRRGAPPGDRPPRDPPMNRMEEEYERGDSPSHEPDTAPRDPSAVTPRMPPGEPAPIPSEEADLRRRVTIFNSQIIRAETEEDAAGVWLFEHKMLKVVSNVTYGFLYKNYQSRWPHDPPRLPR